MTTGQPRPATVPERIGALLRIHGVMTSEQIADKMRRPVKALAAQISRAHSYGFIKVHSIENGRTSHLYRWEANDKRPA